MNKYYNLLSEKAILRREIQKEKRKLHKEFVQTNKNLLRFLDIMVIVSILMNFGAVALTNALVVKEKPEVEMYEANTFQAELKGYEPYPQSNELLQSFIKQVFLWLIIISMYAFYRMTVFTSEGMFLLIVTVAYLFLLLGGDFFNDFGYWIGRLMFA